MEISGIRFWPICKNEHKIYCLSEFETGNGNSHPAVEFGMRLEPLQSSTEQKYVTLRNYAYQASNEVFQPIFQKHNFFVRRANCCLGQFSSYYIYGLQRLKITPQQYLAKLIDYTEENKTLNLIWSYYKQECNVNIITKLGFGEGHLKRFNGGLNSLGNGAPYRLIVGKKWTPDIPYENPEYFLTFKWFKQKVMCRDQPWTCEKKMWKPWNPFRPKKDKTN